MDWLEPWSAADLTQEMAAAFEQELDREVGPGHPLFGIRVETVARHRACDDVLFRLLDGSTRVAVVHLTWTRRARETPPWPSTELYPDLQTWAEQRMRPDHLDDLEYNS
jgi:hypothetical protein